MQSIKIDGVSFNINAVFINGRKVFHEEHFNLYPHLDINDRRDALDNIFDIIDYIKHHTKPATTVE